MTKERVILIRILTLVLLLPFILFISYNVSNINTNNALLTRYKANSSDINILQTEILELNQEKERLETVYEDLSSALFSDDSITFYEFCDFIVNSAKNRRVRIDNYSTNDSSEPKRINLSAKGDIRYILDYLNYLYLYDKKIDIDQMSISYNSNENEYKLTMMINFITINSLDKE